MGKKGGKGRPPNHDALSAYIVELKELEPERESEIEKQVPSTNASRVKLVVAPLSEKKPKPKRLQTLKDVKEKDKPPPRPQYLIDVNPLGSALANLKLEDSGKAFKDRHAQIQAEMDCAIVLMLLQAGHLKSLLYPDGISVEWMFQPEGMYGDGITYWAKYAADGSRKLYRTIHRFWSIFAELKIKDELVKEVAENLPIVSVIFGEYSDAEGICDHEIKRVEESSEFDDLCRRVHFLVFQAVAKRCQGKSDYDFRTAELTLDGLDEQLRKKSAGRANLTHYEAKLKQLRRTLYREELRSEIREAWQDLAVGDWPEYSTRIDKDKVKDLLTKLGDEVKGMWAQCVAIDFDTLARATLMIAPDNDKALSDAYNRIKEARGRYEEKKQWGSLQATLFTADTIDITECLYWLARKKKPEAVRLLGEITGRMSLRSRRHTFRSVSTLERLISRLP